MGRAVQKGMEEFLKRELSTSRLRRLGRSGGGCISDGQSYETDSGKVFVKYNTDSKAKVMFDGESASLSALFKTNTIRVPKPIKVVEHPAGRGWVFIMEHLDMRGLSRCQAQLGDQLARLHLHNASLRKKQEKESSRVCSSAAGQLEDELSAESYVDKFGFEIPTCCGFIPMPNEWSNNWVEFYTRQRLQPQVDRLEKEYGDRELRELWSRLEPEIPSLFKGIEIEPALLHGDLWSGNAAENDEGAVTFDPASFYGHHEFDLAIAGMFGGFTEKFYSAYHKLIPKAPGFYQRHQLYLLFHYLNHWSHFGTAYRSQSLAAMEKLCP